MVAMVAAFFDAHRAVLDKEGGSMRGVGLNMAQHNWEMIGVFGVISGLI